MNTPIIALGFAVVALLGACATTPPNTMKIAHKEDMGSCEFLTDVRGGSTYGAYEARENALSYAQELGATHMVWVSETESGDHITLRGDAYRCPSK